MHQAMFWEPGEDGAVRCALCRFRCLIPQGRRGLCGVRENRDGALYTLVYGQCLAERADPIEKKPLFHVEPGSLSYSIATAGCNFRCLHCQNHEISQLPRQQRQLLAAHPLEPAEIVRRAINAGCRAIAYTYTEPTIYFEYAYDTALLARQAGLRNVFVSNGYITCEALEKIAPLLDAANIDLKGFSEQFYREVVGATLNGVLESLRAYRRLGIWLEITTLLIPGHNDHETELRRLAAFIAAELGVETPWHVTAFFPTYRLLDAPATSPAVVERAWRIGREQGLHFVYTGNIRGQGGEDTLCPCCSAVVVARRGFQTRATRLRAGACAACGEKIAGLWTPQG